MSNVGVGTVRRVTALATRVRATGTAVDGSSFVLTRRGEDDEPLALVSQWRDNARGLGLQDLCRAVRDGTPQRASGALGLHIVDVLLGIRDSAREGSVISIGQPSASGPRHSKERRS